MMVLQVRQTKNKAILPHRLLPHCLADHLLTGVMHHNSTPITRCLLLRWQVVEQQKVKSKLG